MVREMAAVSIVVHVNALTSRLVDAAGLGSSAFSPAGTNKGPHAVSGQWVDVDNDRDGA